MNYLHRLCLRVSLGFALFAVIGCESTSMHETSDGKNVKIAGIQEAPSPQVSPVYLVPR